MCQGHMEEVTDLKAGSQVPCPLTQDVAASDKREQGKCKDGAHLQKCKAIVRVRNVAFNYKGYPT